MFGLKYYQRAFYCVLVLTVEVKSDGVPSLLPYFVVSTCASYQMDDCFGILEYFWRYQPQALRIMALPFCCDYAPLHFSHLYFGSTADQTLINMPSSAIQIIKLQYSQLIIKFKIIVVMQSHEDSDLEQGQQVSQKDESSQFILVKTAGRRQLCDVCEAALYKYTCPKCTIKSCGVACLNRHKKNRGCSGIADPFTSIESKHIQEKQVQKDYLFVKQMLSNADKVKKTLSGVDNLGQEPKRFKIMRMNAKRLYNITLLNAPPIIERHRENISFYFVKTKTFYWVIQILYWREEKGKQICERTLTPPTADSKTILQILPSDFLSRSLLETGINTHKKDQFRVFLQRKQKNAIGKQAIELDKLKPICEGLVNQVVYEFPTLIVVHSTLLQNYLSFRIVKTQIKPKVQ